MPSFTVLTASRRSGWQIDALRSVCSQSVTVDDWVIVQEETKDRRAATTTVKSPGPLVHWVKPPRMTRKSNLNASLNAGLKRIKTDYVIFYQDFIDLQPDCFEKLLALATPDTYVTTATINADGKKDLRYLGLDCVRPCKPEEWEANVAIAPMAVIRELGGFDEEYDNGWSWDNVNLAERAEMLGCKFLLDETNNPQLLPHDKPSDELLQLPNGEFHTQRMRDIREGKFPLRLDYLS